MARKSSMSLMRGVPVRAMSSGETPGVRSRMRSAIASTLRDRCDCTFLIMWASSTTMPLNPKREIQLRWRSRIS